MKQNSQQSAACIRAEKGPDGLKVFLPPALAGAELPFALKIAR